MTELTRRALVGLSVGGLSALCVPPALLAATPPQCVTGPLPQFLPKMLSVDCATRHNFQTFRRNSDCLGLAGVVSMSFVSGGQGQYPAGNLFLFPWVKPKGKKKTFSALMPTSATLCVNATPIPGGTLPPDEFFCRFILQAPMTSFIGFQVDVPYDAFEPKLGWASNVDRLRDGKGVGVDWTSSNLNSPWFGGSHCIPNNDACEGQAWRKLIVAGLERASAPAC